MHIRSILALAAVVLAISSAAAADDQFATLGGVTAETMLPAEMEQVVGSFFTIFFVSPTTISGKTTLTLDEGIVADNGAGLVGENGIKFFHGGCAAGSGRVCGAGRLDGWTGDPLPRGF